MMLLRWLALTALCALIYMVGYCQGSNNGYGIGKCEGTMFKDYLECRERYK